MRFVVNHPQPFIVSVRHQDESHVHSVHEPIRTIPASDREFAVIQPVLAPFFAGVGGRKGQSPETAVTQPYHTITAKGDTVLVAPSLVRLAHGERDATGKKRGKGEHAITEPLPTQPCSNEFALVAPTLIQVGYGERDGQAPRILDLHQPLGTIVGQGMKHALVAAVIAKHNGGWDNRSGYKPDEPLHTIIAHGGQQAVVAAFLAKHNGGHEATGQMFTQPADTITCRENKALVTAHIQRDFGNSIGAQADAPAPTITAGGGGKSALVTSHLVKFKGTCRDGQAVDEPIHTVQAHGNHYAEVRVEAHALKDARIPESAYKVYAFLMKYYGNEKDGASLRARSAPS
jgi:DNA (cytosine-5)-methyltransferase 1